MGDDNQQLFWHQYELERQEYEAWVELALEANTENEIHVAETEYFNN